MYPRLEMVSGGGFGYICVKSKDYEKIACSYQYQDPLCLDPSFDDVFPRSPVHFISGS